jgi:hypothetical protein
MRLGDNKDLAAKLDKVGQAVSVSDQKSKIIKQLAIIRQEIPYLMSSLQSEELSKSMDTISKATSMLCTIDNENSQEISKEFSRLKEAVSNLNKILNRFGEITHTDKS